jgi:uncharacterized ion transporter superfamily protein YfcC
VKTMVLVAIVSLVIAAGAADSAAQTAGSTLISTEQLREVATGWSAKKQILGKDVYNDAGEKIGGINDLIVAPNRAVSYAIVGVGGFVPRHGRAQRRGAGVQAQAADGQDRPARRDHGRAEGGS